MYKYEITDDNGEFVAAGSCKYHSADTARELCFCELDNISHIYDCQRDKGEHGTWCYDIIAFLDDEGTITPETFTVTIR
jgi:hypothetical protein